MSTITMSDQSYYEYNITIYDTEKGTPEKFLSDKDNIFAPEFPLLRSFNLNNEEERKNLKDILHLTFNTWIYPKLIINYPEVFEKNLKYIRNFYLQQEIESQLYFSTITDSLSSKDIEEYPNSCCRYTFVVVYTKYKRDLPLRLFDGNIYLCK